MDKLKKVFSPGSSKDDEVMYGQQGGSKVPGAVDPNTQLETDEGKKEHGVLRQILNPHGEKYSEESYGTTAHAVDGSGSKLGGASGAVGQEQGSSSAIPGTTVSRLQKDDNELDRESSMSIKSGVLGPYAGDAADEPPVGAASSSATGASDAHLGRNDPAGAAATAAFLGTGSGAAGHQGSQRDPATGVPSSTTSSSPYQTRDTTAAAPVASSYTSSQPTQHNNIGSSTTSASTNPYGPKSDTIGSTTTAGSTNPYEGRDVAAAGPVGASLMSSQGVGGDDSGRGVVSPTDESHFGRDAAIAGGVGAGAVGAGALAHEGIHREDHGDDISGATYTARSHYIGGGDDHSGLGASTSASQPISTDPNPPQIPADHPHARDTSLAGAGTIVGGEHVAARDLATQEDKHPEQDVASATYTARSYPVGGVAAASTTANQTADLGGHVPGEYPSESGEDPHGLPGTFPREEPIGRSTGTSATSTDATAPAEKRSTGSKIASALGFGGAGAAAGGAAGYEASKKDEKPTTTTATSSSSQNNPIMTPTNSTPHATSSGQQAQSVQPSSLTSSQPSTQSPEHHYGRDAAVAGGVGAAGVGAYELAKDRTPQGDTYQPDPRRGAPSSDRAYASQSGGTDPSSTTLGSGAPTSGDHHYGRDAAVAGGVGATGAGAYGLGQERFQQHEGQQSGLGQSATPQTYQPDTSRGVPSGSDAYQSQRAEPPKSDDHHYGRDAAIAGGAGAAGVGAYELGKDRSSQEPTYATYQPDTSRGAPSSEGPSSLTSSTQRNEPSGLTSSTQRTEPSTFASQTQRTEPSGLASSTQRIEPEDHHYGRDAAIAGGAGAAGVGAYEHGKDRTPQGDTYQPDPRRGAPSSDQASSTAYGSQRAEPQQQPEHHYGRDAAVVGGTGAAGVGAYELAKDRKDDPYQADPSRGAPSSAQPSTTTTTSQTQRTTQPSTSTTQPQRTEPEHHYGRDAAVVGGTGAAGAGAYELGKDRKEDPYSSTTGTQGAQTSTLPDRSATSTQRTEPQGQDDQHHYGRDAAVAGGVGAAGVGAYELGKDRDYEPRPTKEELIRASGAEPEKTTSKESTPSKSGGLFSRKDKDEKPETMKEKHEEKKQEKEEKPSKSGGLFGSKKDKEDTPGDKDDKHYGRDAAAAGGAGAAGVGAYEAYEHRDTGPASKTIGPHDSNVANVVDPRVKPEPSQMKEQEPITSGPYKSDLANVADPRVTSDKEKAAQEGTQHHYGRDAAVVGGTGAAGAGAYEAYEHRDQGAQKENQQSRHGKDREGDYIVGASGAQGGYSPHHHHGSHEQWEKDNKTAVDSHGHSKLHKKAVDEPAESKPSLMSRILHPNRTKREEEERRASQEHGRASQEHGSRHMGTDGPIGDDNRVSGLESSSASPAGKASTEASSSQRAASGQHPLTQSLPTDERGYITLVNEGADPDAHHVTITDRK